MVLAVFLGMVRFGFWKTIIVGPALNEVFFLGKKEKRKKGHFWIQKRPFLVLEN